MMDVELAWAAGLFEGEGTIRINKPTRRNLGHLCVSVVNTDAEVVDWFQKRWPGYCKPATGLDPLRQRPAWVWVIAAQKAAAFLTAIRPFIVRRTVRDKIDLALTFQAQKKRGLITRGEAYRLAQWDAYRQMRDLNVRGVHAAQKGAA